ncbi:AI-2E family transporter [Aquabacterium sp. A7-Y]|uniref:AI-2E family transporter n=1 Tax=Aquabacterium sp. A7-Y TaxID=1349605 RepID=UPI00223D0547|nr:AI-2E family transporter [Aquabacterium sp. A7-Y]MCW7542046.1 AI-2E family transporter [Aquabacterium sp. A7-Y]
MKRAPLSMGGALGTPANWLRAFAMLGCAAIMLGLLYWLQGVLIPIALALLLTFLMSPPILAMQRRGVPRFAAVIVMLAVVAGLIGGIGWTVVHQANRLVDDFPRYERNLNIKIAEFKRDDPGVMERLQRIMSRVSRQLQKAQVLPAPEGETPRTVRVVEDSGPFQLGRLWNAFGPVIEPVSMVAFAFVLVVFMLLRREDLRDRLITLVGQARLVPTTKMLDEAADRISRYLLMQFTINAGHGIAVAAGLWLIGVPYAVMWGLLAAVLRYVPYIGPWIAAVFPLLLSLVINTTWMPALEVLGLFLVLETISNMLLEPVLYGRGIGISETATLVMVAFWTWLWGPIGLLLATPLTVCLVVLGHYVPALRFFDTLLGDRPALAPGARFYQRLLARDRHEAREVAAAQVQAAGLPAVFDELLMPALCYARRDLERDALDEDDVNFVVESVRELALELEAPEAPRTVEREGPPLLALPLLVVPVRDTSAAAAALLLERVLEPGGFALQTCDPGTLVSEVVAALDERPTPVACIVLASGSAIGYAQLLCKRLHGLPQPPRLVVACFGRHTDLADACSSLLAAGADRVTTTLAEARTELSALRSQLASASLPGREAIRADSTLQTAAELGPTPA